MSGRNPIGLCRRCGVELNESNCNQSWTKYHVRICKECDKGRSLEYYRAHRNRSNRRSRLYYHRNKAYFSEYYNRRNNALKLAAMRHYSIGAIGCTDPFGLHRVPYTNVTALTIDHIYGGGTKHRRA